MSDKISSVRQFVEDLEKTAAQILKFTEEATETVFMGDVMMQWSVIRGIEILGEASKNILDLQPDVQTRFPNIEFKQMYSTRNRLIHGYNSVDLPIVWDIVQNRVAPLHVAAKAALSNWPSDLT